MTRLLTREELDRLLIQALVAERRRHVDDEIEADSTDGTWNGTCAHTAPEDYGVKRWRS